MYRCQSISSLLAKGCSTIYPMIYDLWDIFILGKTRYSPHRTGIVYAPHRRGSGIVWVLDNDTLDTYSKKSWH